MGTLGWLLFLTIAVIAACFWVFKRISTQQQMAEIQKAGDHAWDQLREGADKAWKAMDESFKKAWSVFK